MKLVMHTPMHHCNTNGIKLMCASKGIECEFTFDDNRIKIPNYDILILNEKYICPDLIPESIKIIMGPQHFVFPQGPLVGPLNPKWAERCAYNVLSDWNITVHKEFGQMTIPLVTFPFAVDVDKFTPKNIEKDIDCLLYIKERKPDDINYILEEVAKHNLKTIKIIYQSYKEEDFLNALHRSKFMIVIGRHESQGFALEEAMSCNIPLLVVDAKTMHEEYVNDRFYFKDNYGKYDLKATSVPYWSDKCGIKITELHQFPDALKQMCEKYSTFKPREFVLRELSPEACMNRILYYFRLNSS